MTAKSRRPRPANSSPAKILIVDDHPIVRQGLGRLINREEGLAVCGEAAEAHQALQQVAALKPDLIIVDISLKDVDGLELIKQVRGRFRKLPILVLSMHKESLYAERVLRAGAKGYIMKQESPEKVLHAIRKVLKGAIYLSEPMEGRLLQQLAGNPSPKGIPPVHTLSDRELAIFELIGSGHATRQIAEALHLSVKTIESYREHIKEKLNLENATELAQHAFEWVRDGSKN